MIRAFFCYKSMDMSLICCWIFGNTTYSITYSPRETPPLNDESAGTGTSTTDWVDLVVGEGGVIDWVVPGWRGEYSKSK